MPPFCVFARIEVVPARIEVVLARFGSGIGQFFRPLWRARVPIYPLPVDYSGDKLWIKPVFRIDSYKTGGKGEKERIALPPMNGFCSLRFMRKTLRSNLDSCTCRGASLPTPAAAAVFSQPPSRFPAETQRRAPPYSTPAAIHKSILPAGGIPRRVCAADFRRIGITSGAVCVFFRAIFRVKRGT